MIGIDHQRALAIARGSSKYCISERQSLQDSGNSFSYYVEYVVASRPTVLPRDCQAMVGSGNWVHERNPPESWGYSIRRWPLPVQTLPSLEES